MSFLDECYLSFGLDAIKQRRNELNGEDLQDVIVMLVLRVEVLEQRLNAAERANAEA